MQGLGRLYIPDERDNDYPVSPVLRSSQGRVSRTWGVSRWWGDQGGTSMCVAYSWAHWAERPMQQYRSRGLSTTPWRSSGGHVRDHFGGHTFAGQSPLFDLDDGYAWMQRNDEWPGEDYDGTSVRAGAKYLQSLGLIQSYHWTWDVSELAQAVLSSGPVTVGTDWTYDMFMSDSQGYLNYSGESFGGHAYLVDGVDMLSRHFRIKNSWGKRWNRGGFGYIRFNDMQRLLDNYGEACLAVPA